MTDVGGWVSLTYATRRVYGVLRNAAGRVSLRPCPHTFLSSLLSSVTCGPKGDTWRHDGRMERVTRPFILAASIVIVSPKDRN